MIFHFLTKCFIDQGSCFAVHTELGCFWLELYFDGMCSLKNHPCWCLSAVFISGAPSIHEYLWNKVCRAQQCLALLAAAQLSLLSFGAPGAGWGGRTEPNQALNVPGVGISSQGEGTKGRDWDWDEWVLCLPRSLGWWDCVPSLLFSLKEKFLF